MLRWSMAKSMMYVLKNTTLICCHRLPYLLKRIQYLPVAARIVSSARVRTQKDITKTCPKLGREILIKRTTLQIKNIQERNRSKRELPSFRLTPWTEEILTIVESTMVTSRKSLKRSIWSWLFKLEQIWKYKRSHWKIWREADRQMWEVWGCCHHLLAWWRPIRHPWPKLKRMGEREGCPSQIGISLTVW